MSGLSIQDRDWPQISSVSSERVSGYPTLGTGAAERARGTMRGTRGGDTFGEPHHHDYSDASNELGDTDIERKRESYRMIRTPKLRRAHRLLFRTSTVAVSKACQNLVSTLAGCEAAQ